MHHAPMLGLNGLVTGGSAPLQLLSPGQLLGSLAIWAGVPMVSTRLCGLLAPSSPQCFGACGLSLLGPSRLCPRGLGFCGGSVKQCLVCEETGCPCCGRGVGLGSAGRTLVC